MNTSAVTINLAGWKLMDIADNTPSFIFPAGLAVSGQEIRVFTNEVHPDSGGYSFNRGTAIWNNCDPDVAGLFDPAGNLVSKMSYAKSSAC